jgi:hypothetical protein
MGGFPGNPQELGARKEEPTRCALGENLGSPNFEPSVVRAKRLATIAGLKEVHSRAIGDHDSARKWGERAKCADSLVTLLQRTTGL